MFKIILRTLSALSIVTITASAGFAEHPEHTLNLPCTDPANAHTEKCRAKAGIKPVTTDVWKDSFESGSVPPPTDPNPTSRRDQFISPEASLDHYELEERVNLQFDINNDGTNTIVGTSIFYIAKNGNERNFYAGIRAGADLGAPLVEAFPEAVWKTRFKAVGSYNLGVDFQVNEIFDLTVKFISNSADPEAMGELSGYIQHTGYYGFKIDAQFNNAGVITGTDGITYGRFENAGAEPTDTIVGKLTGIIGERGTLGAFHSDGNSNSTIRGFAGGFRANGYSEDDLVALRSCALDPFKEQCSADRFDALKVAHIKLCIEGDNASDTNPIECRNAILAEGCIRNPFQDICMGEESDFNQYSEAARTNRIAFCDNSANAKDAFCKVGTIVTDVCVDDPFHAICGADYNEAVNDWLIACEAGTATADDPRCVRAKPINRACGRNPFGANCGFDTFDDERDARITFCLVEGNATNPLCTTAGTDIALTFKGSLNLANASFGGTLLGGDAADGVGFVSVTGDSNYDYVGILDDTDLGAPVSQKSGSAEWGGEFKVINSGNLYSSDFTLIVDFTGTDTTAGSVSAYISSVKPVSGVGTNLNPFKIAGTFDSNGVISGYVRHGAGVIADTTDASLEGRGKLTGLIGQEGAVGAFTADEGGNYAGGFVAKPPVVNFADWVNSFDAPPPLTPDTDNPRSQFLQGTADGVDRGDVELPVYNGVEYYYGDLNLNTATFDGSKFGGDAADGVAFFGSTGYKFYNGIFSGTDLGAPLVRPTEEADRKMAWYGQFQLGSYFKTDFTLEIDFNTESTGTIAAFINYYLGIDEGDYYVLLEGDFDANGVISGTSVWGYFANHDRIATEIEGEGSEYIITGLIGAEGAVGAFRLGGFVAVPSVAFDPNVKFSDWVRSFDESPDPALARNETRQTLFLQGSEQRLPTGFLNAPEVPRPLTLAHVNTDRDVADGVVYVFGTRLHANPRTGSYDIKRKHHIAGILSGTNLGASLETPVTAVWGGELGMAVNSVNIGPRDITLNINFTDAGKSIIIAYTGEHNAHLVNFDNLSWDDNGVITGEVTYNPGSALDDATNSPGIVRGLIGQEGLVGVFRSDHGDAHTNTNTPYAGGFVAVPRHVQVVKFSDWLGGFDESPYRRRPLRDTQQTRFLKGGRTSIHAGGYYIKDIVRPASPLTLADVNTDGEVADGVDYLSGTQSYNISRTERGVYDSEIRTYKIITKHHYAGILSGTRLGANLPTVPAGADGNPITANWKGRLGLIADGSEVAPRDIALTVDFTNTNITIVDTKTDDNKHFVSFSGLGWDKNGVITGRITYDATPTLQTNGSYAVSDGSEGIVSGLIGQDGAVGAFRSTHVDNPTATHTSFAGGFVAAPGAEYIDWVNSFSDPSELLTTLPWIDRERQTRFVQGSETGVDPGNVSNPVIRTLKLADGDLGGEAADGVVYALKSWSFAERDGSRSIRHRLVSGILSGTYLGASLDTVPAGANGAITTIWDGILGLMANGSSDIPNRDIGLTVDFTNNKISYRGAVDGAHFVDLNAKWIHDNIADGVLKGTITYNPGAALDKLAVNSADSAGIVTGLIGQQGAVGAFRSNHVDNPTATHTSYAGGFVAVPVVDYQIWKHSFGNPTTLPAEVPWYNEQGQQTRLLQGTGTGLNTRLIGNGDLETLDFANSGLGGDAADGVAYVFKNWDVLKDGVRVNVPRHYAGILSGTNLGALLNAPVTATWNGKLGLIVDLVDVAPRDITLNIDFANTGITIADTKTTANKHFVAFNGLSFDEAGVISGTMTYNPGSALNDATNSAGKVTGLIGQRGAVGAFISNPDNPSSKAAYAGGFVARPAQ